jgi:hypothetical protein
MKFLKAAILSAALATAGAVTAGAAEPASTTPAYPPQVATGPGLPNSSARPPGPKTGPSGWIPGTPSIATPNSGVDTEGSYYSRKGFGPKPHDD